MTSRWRHRRILWPWATIRSSRRSRRAAVRRCGGGGSGQPPCGGRRVLYASPGLNGAAVRRPCIRVLLGRWRAPPVGWCDRLAGPSARPSARSGLRSAIRWRAPVALPGADGSENLEGVCRLRRYSSARRSRRPSTSSAWANGRGCSARASLSQGNAQRLGCCQGVAPPTAVAHPGPAGQWPGSGSAWLEARGLLHELAAEGTTPCRRPATRWRRSRGSQPGSASSIRDGWWKELGTTDLARWSGSGWCSATRDDQAAAAVLQRGRLPGLRRSMAARLTTMGQRAVRSPDELAVILVQAWLLPDPPGRGCAAPPPDALLPADRGGGHA